MRMNSKQVIIRVLGDIAIAVLTAVITCRPECGGPGASAWVNRPA